ncbi:hypothetical protein KOI40_06500 [Aestuariicella sp. G3-2]|uniref:DUF6776 family protein n=1 Tax=Pseudomaricurvus albidus TaxID=2842452 RepID=UPI001C0BCBC2|nr:DUF6776 family protein [Aestuariicella albida]MBU3069465.1 hypothetical protein [Aestuariicella albida]
MGTVKGSKQQRMVVVPYRPWRKAMLTLLLLAVSAAAVYGSYWFGQNQSHNLQEEAVAERDRLRVELADATSEADRLRQEVVNLKLGAEVDRKASEGVRNEVLELKSEIAGLQEDISFYRGLMSPSDNAQGLTIGSLNVISTGVPRQYEYKLVVQQLATKHNLLKGSLKFTIVGRQGEQLVTLPLKDVSDNVTSESITLRFKYFQTIEGRISLPASFEPERIELVAKSSGREPVVVEKKFGWLVQES